MCWVSTGFSYLDRYTHIYYKICFCYVSIEEKDVKYHLMYVLLSRKSCFPLSLIIALI